MTGWQFARLLAAALPGGWFGWVLWRLAALLLGGWVARRWLRGWAFDRGFRRGLAARNRTVRAMIGRDDEPPAAAVCTCRVGDPSVSCALHPYRVVRSVVEWSTCRRCGVTIRRDAGGLWLSLGGRVEWCYQDSGARPLHEPGIVGLTEGPRRG